jgi:hypothetical protein
MRKRLDDGGPAFPTDHDHRSKGLISIRVRGGMSLRDYFAAHALAVIPGDLAEPAAIARDAYRIADALLARRRAHAKT